MAVNQYPVTQYPVSSETPASSALLQIANRELRLYWVLSTGNFFLSTLI